MQFTRKQFLKAAALLMSIYPLKLFYDASEKAATGSVRGVKQVLPLDLPEGISFHGKIIAQRKEDKLSFFSARCPHLGCQINNFENGELVCPCHGSRFSDEGKVLAGPAVDDLSSLTHQVDTNNRQVTVILKS